MKMTGFKSFAIAAAEAYKHGYWPVFRRDGMHVYGNDDGDAIAFTRDGCGIVTITRDFPTDKPTEEIDMTMETNSTDTGTSTAATPATDVGKKAAVRKPRPSELAMKAAKAAKAAKAVKAGAASNGKGTSKSAAKTTPKGTSGTPKAGKTTTSGTTKVSKPAKTMKTTPKKGSTATDSKSKLPAAGKKTAAEKGSEGRSSGPRPGSGMAFVLKLVKAGKTDEEILATAAKELPKVKSVNDPRGVTWYRWQLKKNGWI